ncbi:cytosolic phospholipase A2 gamma-like isoform X2 [Pyxicephalus adspersus]|uniref:cytosolic phospholipase A2 gamma-like isoform X2 n=1 Tax=Pyxicephalus adspersus TaxID=30357 RepID=UPI003B5C56FF
MSCELSKENVDIVDGSNNTSESAGETVSVKARKEKVKGAFLPLGINVKEYFKPPVIAVLGSGGGLRAMVGLQGTLSKLSELNLLDVVTYIAATSGSTWCMSFLYSNKNWTEFSCMKNLESQLCEQIKNATKRNWGESWMMIKERFLGEMYSLTDFWAYAVIFKITNTINRGKLSGHKAGCENGTHPYPIYAAVEKESLQNNDLGSWFEFTPHLSGFPAYKSYVKSELLGSKFEAGCLLEEQAERDLTYLEGLWGSAIGDTVPHLVHGLLHDAIQDFMSSLYGDTLKTTQRMHHCIPDTVEYASYASMVKRNTIQGVCENATVIKNIVSCIVQWKWGTTNNFLYQWKNKMLEECEISTKEHISLIDAGLDINTPYLLMLPPHRKVDLILSFDFSQGDPFLTLTQTAEYCKKYKLPFPEINIDDNDKDIPSKSCYSFEGDGNEVPHVMHFPQFNVETCADAEKVKELRKTYGTFVVSYEESQLKELLDIGKKNVENNKNRILEKIKQCVEQCNRT